MDMRDMVPLADVPISMLADKREAMTKDHFDAAVVDGKLRF